MSPRALAPALLAWIVVATGQPHAHEERLRTHAGMSGFEQASTYAEFERLVSALTASPLVHRDSSGRSEEGRELPLLVIADPPIATPVDARKRGRPVVLIQAGLHDREAEGTEAALMLARRLTDGDLKPLTRQLVILIVPIANPDDRERRVGDDDRSELDGPTGAVGSGANARGLDLNRDYMKLERAEARALTSLIAAWDPHVVADLHSTTASTRGAQLTCQPTQTPNADARLVTFARDTLLAGVGRALLDAHGYRSEVSSEVAPAATDPDQAGHVDHRPRASHNYVGLRNRIGVLVEVGEHLDAPTRVAVTAAFVEELLRASARHALRVLSLTAQADRTLTMRTRASKPLDLGLEFGPQSNGATVPANAIAALTATRTRPLPSAWIIPRGLASSPRMAAALDRLRWHGIETETLDAPAQMDVDRFVVQSIVQSARAVEHRNDVHLGVTMERAALTVDPGSVLITANQRLARLAFYLLEPDSDDGLVTWNVIGEGLTVGQGFPVYRVR